MQKNCGHTFLGVINLKIENYLIMPSAAEALLNSKNSEACFF